MQLDKPKFCRDCKHYRSSFYGYGVRLAHEFCMSPHIEPDLVSGHGEMAPDIARAADDYCGREAKWFEPKAPPVVRQHSDFKPLEPRPWWKIWA